MIVARLRISVLITINYRGVPMYDIEFKYKVGDRVTYRGSFGNGLIQTVTIEDRDEKNDRPIYDLSNNHWCYEDQIIGHA